VGLRTSSRRLWLAPAILAFAWILAWMDPETGLRKWLGLRSDLAAARERIEMLEAEVLRIQEEAARLEGDPLAIEAAIREDLGLARPGETVVILRNEADLGLRSEP